MPNPMGYNQYTGKKGAGKGGRKGIKTTAAQLKTAAERKKGLSGVNYNSKAFKAMAAKQKRKGVI